MAEAIKQEGVEREKIIKLELEATLATEQNEKKRDAARKKADADIKRSQTETEIALEHNHEAELQRIADIASRQKAVVDAQKTAVELQMQQHAKLGQSTEADLKAQYDLTKQSIELEYEMARAAALKLGPEDQSLALKKAELDHQNALTKAAYDYRDALKAVQQQQQANSAVRSPDEEFGGTDGGGFLNPLRLPNGRLTPPESKPGGDAKDRSSADSHDRSNPGGMPSGANPDGSYGKYNGGSAKQNPDGSYGAPSGASGAQNPDGSYGAPLPASGAGSTSTSKTVTVLIDGQTVGHYTVAAADNSVAPNGMPQSMVRAQEAYYTVPSFGT